METRSVDGTISAGTRGDTVKDTDIGKFLGGGHLGDLLESLTLTMGGSYKKSGSDYERSSRRLYLYISLFGHNSVTLDGDEEWILRVKASLDGFFATRKRNVRGLRLAIAAVLAIAPATVLGSVALRLDSEALLAVAVFWAPLGFMGFLNRAEAWHPDNLIVIDERGLRSRWYVVWTRKLLAGVLTNAIAAILLTLVWPR